MTGETPAVHEALAVYAPETTETERVPEGYKPSEVGVIPEDWEVRKLGAFANILRGASPRPIDSPIWFNEKSNTGWLRISDATSADKYLTKTSHNLSAAGISNSRFVESGNLVMSICATVGRPVLTRKNVCIHDGFVVFNDLRVDKEYLYYVLSNIEKDWSKHGQTGSQMNLNTGLIGSTPIPLPPLHEQRAIAAALSDVDTLIFALDNLIAKKRAVKTAAMQQLLTGKQRLPGFSGEWEVKRLGDIAPLQRGFDLPNSMLRKGDYPVVYSNGILNHHAHFMAEGPGVVTGRSGTIGKVSYVEEDYWPHNTALWVTDFKGNSPKFIYHLYKNVGLDRFGTGSGVPTLNRNDVHAFSVSVPSSEEQTTIAAVLSDMDAEIEALEARREKTRQVKRGMMQELLTGRTRLV